jgi:hypothetical protein
MKSCANFSENDRLSSSIQILQLLTASLPSHVMLQEQYLVLDLDLDLEFHQVQFTPYIMHASSSLHSSPALPLHRPGRFSVPHAPQVDPQLLHCVGCCAGMD